MTQPAGNQNTGQDCPLGPTLFITGRAIYDSAKATRMEGLLMGLFGNKGVSGPSKPDYTVDDKTLGPKPNTGVTPRRDKALIGGDNSPTARRTSDVNPRQRAQR